MHEDISLNDDDYQGCPVVTPIAGGVAAEELSEVERQQLNPL